MKAIKIAGIRLINYVNDGVNWKDHKDIVLDFWIVHKCRDFGYQSGQFRDMFYTDELPSEAHEHYEKWFNKYNFQNEDKEWIDFVDGTLNIFYGTSDPTMLDEDTWYVFMTKSEVEAREICEEQIFHGSPNINSFWKIDTNTKREEVGGRRNGFIFGDELTKVSPRDTKDNYWAVAFQCPESIKLYYKSQNDKKSKCINWAADCKHMTLMKITSSGRFRVKQVFVEGKAWRDDRLVPQTKVPMDPMTGQSMARYFNSNFHEMYGIWDAIDEIKKDAQESANQRKNAVNTMNDEEVKVAKVIPMTINRFIAAGNVPRKKREKNKAARQAIREKNKLREREIKKKMREIIKEEGKQVRSDRNRVNPFVEDM